MSINLKLVAQIFTNNSSGSDYNLKTLANLYNGTQVNNVSMYNTFKLLGDSNLHVLSSVANDGSYYGDQTTIYYRLKYSNSNNTGIFFQNLFDYNGTPSGFNLFTNMTTTFGTATYNSIGGSIDISSVPSGVNIGGTFSITITFTLDTSFKNFAKITDETLQYIQTLRYDEHPIS